MATTQKPSGRGRPRKEIPKQTHRGRPTEADLAEISKIRPLPDGPADEHGLTLRQRLILHTIREAVEARGFPPTIREMGEAVGLASPSSVTHQLKVLETKGFIVRDPKRPRALMVRMPGEEEQEFAASATAGLEGLDPDVHTSPAVHVPLVGRIAAGVPITAEQHVDDVMRLPERLTGTGNLFMLEVHGDSMIDAAICDGDFVVVREQNTAENGDIVAALLDDFMPDVTITVGK